MRGRGGGSDERKGEEVQMRGRGGGSDERKGEELVACLIPAFMENVQMHWHY